MPNHVHLIAVPPAEQSLADAVGRTRWRCTRTVNFRLACRGRLRQGRFASCPMERSHTLAAAPFDKLRTRPS